MPCPVNCPGDEIVVGNEVIRVVEVRDDVRQVDYDDMTLEVDRPISTNVGDEVFLSKTGNLTDVGAYGLSGTEPTVTPLPPSPSPTPTYTTNDLQVLINDWQMENPDSEYDLNVDGVVNAQDYAVMVIGM